MSNEQNLRPVKSKEEARERGAKGGKASVEARRRKKTMKEAINLLLSLPVDDANQKKLQQLGIDARNADNQMLMMVAAFREAINGNVRAMEFIKSITGSQALTELDKQQIKLEKAKIELQKEKLKQFNIEPEETEDDGFIKALNSSAKEDWDDEETGNI